jgi:hypothetical protein
MCLRTTVHWTSEPARERLDRNVVYAGKHALHLSGSENTAQVRQRRPSACGVRCACELPRCRMPRFFRGPAQRALTEARSRRAAGMSTNSTSPGPSSTGQDNGLTLGVGIGAAFAVLIGCIVFFYLRRRGGSDDEEVVEFIEIRGTRESINRLNLASLDGRLSLSAEDLAQHIREKEAEVATAEHHVAVHGSERSGQPAGPAGRGPSAGLQLEAPVE